MKKVLLTLLVVILILGALGAAGFAGYRYGYSQGLLATSNGEPLFVTPGFNPYRMPYHHFGFERGFDRGNFGMMGRGGMGFGFFGPLLFLVQLAFWALVIWAIYALITRSGWRLTKTEPAPGSPSPASAQPPVDNNESST